MVTVAELAQSVGAAIRRGDDDAVVVEVTHDSRQVEPGHCFVALVGANVDGHDHVAAAAQQGAVAAIVDHEVDVDVAQLVVPATRPAAGPAAAVVHGHPSGALDVVGTTGTNGKTTISWMLEAAAAAGGRATGLLGTTGTRINGAQIPTEHTTPEGPVLQRLLATMRDRGVQVVAMEVSSHGLSMHRVDGTRFDVALFTNLTQDHLDFHGSMEDYFAAKARLFTPAFSERAVIGVFDDWGRRMARTATVEAVTIGEGPDATVRLEAGERTLDGSSGRLVGPAEWLGGHDQVEFHTPLQGHFNLRNAAQALVAAVALGIDAEAAVAGIGAADDVPGRFELVLREPVAALVDYAHSPDAIDAVIGALRGSTDGRIIVVVGAGGDRDQAKRGPMGAAAAAADVVVFTSDNPRSEEPGAIIRQLLDGAMSRPTDGERTHIEAIEERGAAIDRALQIAAPGDVVAVLGKGHETGQQIGQYVRPFDDREVLRTLADRART